MEGVLAAIPAPGQAVWLGWCHHTGSTYLLLEGWCTGVLRSAASQGSGHTTEHCSGLWEAVQWLSIARNLPGRTANIQRLASETLEEYASRVRRLVGKVYPEMIGTILGEGITIEHMIGGLADQNLVYDILTKHPRTVEDALDLVCLHESCKGFQKRRSGVRMLTMEDPDCEPDDQPTLVNRVNGKLYVTEERLNQFGRELWDALKGSSNQYCGNRNSQRPRNDEWKKQVECYQCTEIGHIALECPKLKEMEQAVEQAITPEMETSN